MRKMQPRKVNSVAMAKLNETNFPISDNKKHG